MQAASKHLRNLYFKDRKSLTQTVSFLKCVTHGKSYADNAKKGFATLFGFWALKESLDLKVVR
jgi:hypothetical protein